eukprot:11962895-Karenia_brevis.AAC.1
MEARFGKMESSINDNFTKIIERLDKHDEDIADLKLRYDSHDAQITDLTNRLRLLEKDRSRASSVSARPSDQQKLEAFLGGFPSLERHALLARAESIVGKPTGLIKVIAPGPVASY